MLINYPDHLTFCQRISSLFCSATFWIAFKFYQHASTQYLILMATLFIRRRIIWRLAIFYVTCKATSKWLEYCSYLFVKRSSCNYIGTFKFTKRPNGIWDSSNSGSIYSCQPLCSQFSRLYQGIHMQWAKMDCFVHRINTCSSHFMEMSSLT